MVKTHQTDEFTRYLIDRLQPMGPVIAKKMFGCYGLFIEGLMFALVADDVLYLKADKKSAAVFQANNLPPFSYSKKGKTICLNYFQSPDELLENDSELIDWANQAFSCALNSHGVSK
ncbi:MAG: transcriptional regulator [Gammaproteobacteria bacterium]|nr:MAG: transcriptional regulator [Gammaproteobacteria bacterium]